MNADRFREMWLASDRFRISDLLQHYGVKHARLQEMAAELGLPKRKRFAPAEECDPTPAEITERAKAIQAEWSAEEEYSRRTVKSRGGELGRFVTGFKE